MKNIKKRLIGWTLGLALSLGVGIGIASNTHSEIARAEAAGETSVSKTTNDLVTENSWTVSSGSTIGTKFNSFKLDENVTVSFSGTGNTATVWNSTTSGVYEVRVYGDKGKTSGSVTFSGAEGVTIKSIKMSFKTQNSPTINPSVTSDTEYSVGAQSQTFTLTSAAKKAGQFRITSFSCIYTAPSAATLVSISITSLPKIEYYAGEKFDPTGLVVTKTFDDNTKKEFLYAGNEGSFTFNPDKIDELKETDKAILITVDGKTVNLPITVKPARTITSVTLNGDMTNKTYYEGEAWDVSDLYLTVNWNEGEPTTVQLSDLVSGTDYTIAPETASLGIASVDIAGHYADKSFGGTISGLTVTEKPSSMQIAYEAAKKLGLKGKTTVAYEFSGVVVGTIDKSFFVQDEGYGMYVYNKAVSGLAIGKTIDIKSTLQTYNGMIETLDVSSAILGKEAAMPTAATISSAADLKALKQNVLVDLEAVMPATMQNWSSSEGPLNNLMVGTDKIVMKFDKLAYDKSSVSGIYSSLAGKKVSIKNAISSTFGSTETKQLLLTEQTTIEVIEEDNAKALAFGTSFLNKTANACADGTKDNSEALKAAWATLKTEFTALSDGAKKVVKEAAANNAGTDLEKAMARYDHIVKRYSAAHTEINDFIGRGVTPSLTNQLFKANTTNNIMIISLIACASVAAIGSFFFIRKRKEQN